MTHLDVRTTFCIVLLTAVLAQGAVATPVAQPVEPRTDAVAAEPSQPLSETTSMASLSRRFVALSANVGGALVERITGSVDSPAVLLTAAYSRSITEEPLAHEGRNELFESIHARPGISLSTLNTATDLSSSTVRYHLDVLETAGLVQSRTVFGQVRLAEVGVSQARVELRAALSDAGTAPVLTTVARRESPSVSEVAEELSKAPSTVSYHVDRLDATGLVEREQVGRRVEVHLSKRVEAVPIGVALASGASAADGGTFGTAASDETTDP